MLIMSSMPTRLCAFGHSQDFLRADNLAALAAERLELSFGRAAIGDQHVHLGHPAYLRQRDPADLRSISQHYPLARAPTEHRVHPRARWVVVGAAGHGVHRVNAEER